MIKGVIFDLDGVLTNTSVYHYKAWKQLAREKLNYDFTKKDNEAFLGVSRKECIRLLEEMAGITLSQDTREAYLEIKNGYYLGYLNTLAPENLSEGAVALIETCIDDGLKLAIASASKNTRVVLEKTAITDYFDVIVDGNSVTRTKPDPECFLLAADRLGLNPSECIVVEDAQAGIDGANKGGFTSIGIGEKRLLRAYMQFKDIRELHISDVLLALAKEKDMRKEEYCGS